MREAAPPQSEARSGRKRSAAGRLLNGLLWWVLPGIILAAVAAYILGATLGHANPPVVPVQGLSMRPTLQGGDLVFLKGADPKSLRKGDIIAVTVPSDVQKQYHLPSHIVHRIVKVKHDRLNGLSFVTKGDANAGNDVFTTQPNDVVGKLRFAIPGAGYPFLFFRSRQGEIFLGAAALLVLLYFGLGLVEDRRIIVEGTAATMQGVLAETQELRAAVEAARRVAAPDGAAALWPGSEDRRVVNDGLAEEVRLTRQRSDETSETMRELVGAIGEYGQHLRSHTSVMQNLAATTAELHRATSSLGLAIAVPAHDEGEQTFEPLVDPQLSLPPELLAQRESLSSLTSRVERLQHELSTSLGLNVAVPAHEAGEQTVEPLLAPQLSLPPELLAQRESLSSLTSRVERLLHELPPSPPVE